MRRRTRAHTSSLARLLTHTRSRLSQPNPDDPLNHEAADQYRSDIRQFEAYVQRSLKGYSVNGESFERLL